MANSALEPAGTAEPKPRSKPSLVSAVKTIFSKSEEPDEGKKIARRRRFVMAAVLGTSPSIFSCSCGSSSRARSTNRRPSSASAIPRDFGFGVDTKFQNALPHLGGAQHRGHLRDLARSARTWAARPTGRPARTSSSAPATAAATIPKASTSKARRRGRWTGPTSSSTPKGRSWWT